MRPDSYSGPTHSLLGLATILWRIISVPILFVLAMLEPFVRVILSALGFLGLCTTIFYALVLPDFPIWTMLTISLSFWAALLLYYGLIRLLMPRE